ncbi:hypothetical protein Q0M94_21690 (plasmid) [Deinococcus radiomollis]|uniref:hypothetical protein n=1 Tax=Deinococcus radiomollis TaxID=468916 RepID=UPI0038923CDD
MRYQAEVEFKDRQCPSIDLGTWELYAEARESCEMHAVQVLGWETPKCGLNQATTHRYAYRIIASRE